MCINTESAFPKINIPVRERASTPVCPSVSLTYCTIAQPSPPLTLIRRQTDDLLQYFDVKYIYIYVCVQER